jgi:hypothetical protein
MSMEIRYVIFTKVETQTAIITYVLKQGLAKASEIIGLKINGLDGEVSAKIRLRHPVIEKYVSLEGDDLISCLILCCNQNRIPIPRAGQKRVESSVDGLTLVVTIDVGEAKLPNVTGSLVTYNAVATALEQATEAKNTVIDANRKVAIADTIASDAIARMQIADTASVRAKAHLKGIGEVGGVRGKLGRWLLNFNNGILD